MTALDSIISWAASDLPDWQSDAVRRLLVKSVLADEDRQELLSILKSLHGLLPIGVTSPKPQRLQKGMVSGAPITKGNVVLKAITGLRSINRIPDGSTLPFGHKGLTAVYGENGSGKSGYARVLKRACRARDTQERILPNVYSTQAPMPAKATFKLSVNDDPHEIEWEDGKESDEVLTNITVFDSKCARVIVDEKNEATYLPYGAYVFQELVDLLNWIRLEIEAEKPTPEPLSWSDIPPVTKPGILLIGLTHQTKDEEIENASTWTDNDAEKLGKLTKQLAELEANDPLKQAARSRSFKERVSSLKEYVERRGSRLSDDRLKALKEIVHALAEANKAIELASQATLQDEPLSGAGETAWQILYDAAREYSTTSAYPDDEFPLVGDGSRCVFCMQPLGEDAKKRLLRFAAFMEQAAKKKHEHVIKTLDTVVKSLEGLKDKAVADQHTNTTGEVKQRDDRTASAVEAYLSAMNGRIEYFERLATGKEPGAVPSLPASPAEALAEIICSLEQEVASFEKAVDPLERQKLKDEKAELLARKCLTANRAKVLAYVADLRKAHRCSQATASIDTTVITLKGKAVVSGALTPQLNSAIEEELQKLGADHLPLNLKPSGSQGETLHQLRLDGARLGRKDSLTDVLSEGEQRVVALAGFFAEVGLGLHSCPIVLDDPVSSLDHRYRARIANRLVLESQKRQVLVFTHDIAFLLDLQEKTGEHGGIYFTPQTVLQHNEAAGVPNEGLPWHAMPVKRRLEHLRETLNKIKAFHGTDQVGYDKEAALLYALLRETWEAAIEEVVFNKTVFRHGSEVQTIRLRQVGVTTDQYKAIDVNMSKCSTWMAGHDKSKKLDVHRPGPTELLTDIDALNTFVKDCQKAGEALRKERDAALGPETSQVG